MTSCGQEISTKVQCQTREGVHRETILPGAIIFTLMNFERGKIPKRTPQWRPTNHITENLVKIQVRMRAKKGPRIWRNNKKTRSAQDSISIRSARPFTPSLVVLTEQKRPQSLNCKTHMNVFVCLSACQTAKGWMINQLSAEAANITIVSSGQIE